MPNLNINKLRQVSFFILLVCLGCYLFWQLNNFLPSFLGAITLYVLLRQPLIYLTHKKNWHFSSAALLLMLLSFILVMLPIIAFANVLYSKINYAIAHSNEVLTAAKNFIDSLQQKYQIKIINDNYIQQAEIAVANNLPHILGATFNSLTIIVIMYFILYFLLSNQRNLEAWLYKHLPLKKANTLLIGTELNKLILSNALGLPITALLQGIIGAFAYWLLAINDLPFWFVATCISAMVPLVGSALAFVSVAILLAANGHEIKAILMLLYGIGIMATLDNIFRISIQKKMGNIHPLITIFGVMVGVKIFGFIGLIFGPILLSMLFLLLRIYLNEFEEERS